jgi:hypothetical protein
VDPDVEVFVVLIVLSDSLLEFGEIRSATATLDDEGEVFFDLATDDVVEAGFGVSHDSPEFESDRVRSNSSS